jgi:RNA polymerase sigma-70 factor, ECF subfamily
VILDCTTGHTDHVNATLESRLAWTSSSNIDESQPPSTRRGDPARLRAMMREHFDATWRLLHQLGVRRGDVDDAVQRVFLTASRRLRDIKAGRERAFLMAVASREASHLRRSYRRRAEVAEEALEDRSTGRARPDELASTRQALEFVQDVIVSLEADLRIVFVLFELEGLSSDQIASELEIPVGTVKSRLRRARAQFTLRASELQESML